MPAKSMRSSTSHSSFSGSAGGFVAVSGAPGKHDLVEKVGALAGIVREFTASAKHTSLASLDEVLAATASTGTSPLAQARKIRDAADNLTMATLQAERMLGS